MLLRGVFRCTINNLRFCAPSIASFDRITRLAPIRLINNFDHTQRSTRYYCTSPTSVEPPPTTPALSLEEQIQKTTEKADDGSAVHQHTLGHYHLANKDVIKAFRRFREAADQQYAPAIDQLGNMYMEGQGVAKDSGAAFQLFEEAANQGYPPAIFHLAMCHLFGKGTLENRERGIELLYEAAEKQHNLACYYLAVSILKNSDPQKASELLVASADRGYGPSLFVLGQSYMAQGPNQNVQEGIHYLEQAAMQGIDDAAYMIGRHYQQHAQNDEEKRLAVQFLEAAARQGHVEANLDLGCLYLIGRGVRKDIAKAEEYLKRAGSKAEGSDSHIILANHYMRNNNVQKAVDVLEPVANGGDLKVQELYASMLIELKREPEAMKYYKLAADQGSANSEFMMGGAYLSGIGGLHAQPELAAKYFLSAAEKNHVMAQCSIGILYLDGHGVKKDDEKGLHYLQMAAEHNEVPALCRLGYFYADKKEHAKAFKYFVKAADLGEDTACNIVAEMYSNGVGVEMDKRKAQYYTHHAPRTPSPGSSSPLRQ